jgi:hypothetical protein
MIPLIADDTTLLKEVGMFVEPVEVYDTNGKLLGLFVPGNLERAKEMAAQAATRIDWAEIERRCQNSDRGEPLQVTLDRLRKLEAEIARRKTAGEKDFTVDEGLAYFRSLRAKEAQGTPCPGLPGATGEKDQCPTP